MSAADVCLKCGESRGAIRREGLICWDGYDELGKHRFAPWPNPSSHAPKPGPGYWDWRCLVCSEPVSEHAPWWRRVLNRKPQDGPSSRGSES